MCDMYRGVPPHGGAVVITGTSRMLGGRRLGTGPHRLLGEYLRVLLSLLACFGL